MYIFIIKNLAVKIIKQPEQKFINHRSESISKNNPIKSDIFM
jgi:hypothetical protein